MRRILRKMVRMRRTPRMAKEDDQKEYDERLDNEEEMNEEVLEVRLS
jgi:hypothetical protein